MSTTLAGTGTGAKAGTPTQTLVGTPSQTIGPFFGILLPYEGDNQMVDRTRAGAVRLYGTVLDGNGDGVPDAIVEIWQADENGVISQETGSIVRDGYTFTGFGRSSTDRTGRYQFTTVEPGSVDGGVPFFAVVVFARGMLRKVHTRIYLPESADNEKDALLSAVEPSRRQTLIATREADGSLHHDIRLQGEQETVFIAYS